MRDIAVHLSVQIAAVQERCLTLILNKQRLNPNHPATIFHYVFVIQSSPLVIWQRGHLRLPFVCRCGAFLLLVAVQVDVETDLDTAFIATLLRLFVVRRFSSF